MAVTLNLIVLRQKENAGTAMQRLGVTLIIRRRAICVVVEMVGLGHLSRRYLIVVTNLEMGEIRTGENKHQRSECTQHFPQATNVCPYA